MLPSPIRRYRCEKISNSFQGGISSVTFRGSNIGAETLVFTRAIKEQALPRESSVTARVFTRDDRGPDQGVTYNTKKRREEGQKWGRDGDVERTKKEKGKVGVRGGWTRSIGR